MWQTSISSLFSSTVGTTLHTCVVTKFEIKSFFASHLLLLLLTLMVGVAMVVVEETVWASSPSMVQRFAHFDLPVT